ncbi:MAG TPA: DUF2231 domain-containing protein [candidate division Zixibacteria bacterium]
MLVHLPIAMVFTVLLLDWGRWIFGRDRLLEADFWGGTTPLLILALIGGGAAVITGLQAEEGIPVETPIIHELVEAHELSAFIVTGTLALLTFWRIALRGAFPRKLSFVYLFLLIAVAAVISYGAYFGGLMVYSHGVGVDRPL